MLSPENYQVELLPGVVAVSSQHLEGDDVVCGHLWPPPTADFTLALLSALVGDL
jgi:hypothetical protein